MSHKVHPESFRIKETKDWHSRGFYANDFPLKLEEDFKIREFIEEKVGKFGLGGTDIERSPGKINIIISTARPGLVIGRAGEGVEKLKKELAKVILKTRKSNKKDNNKTDLRIEIREIKNIWLSAPLMAQMVASQIERRMQFRKVLKKTLAKIMSHREAKGARIEISGRLNGVDIARREWLRVGLLPRQTIRADIDYAQATAFCTYGAVGIKVWIYKGEKFD